MPLCSQRAIRSFSLCQRQWILYRQNGADLQSCGAVRKYGFSVHASTAFWKNAYHLKFAVITGCLRIAKESIFTGVNNFSTFSVLDERYADCFGFTPAEVDRLLVEFKLEHKAEIIRQWYDGYRFGNADIYCPWDVVSYVSDLLYSENTSPKNYWKNTGGNGVIKSFFERAEFEVSDKFGTLLNGGYIRENVEADLTYDRLYPIETR